MSALWLPANGALHGVLFDHLLIWNLAAIAAVGVLAHLLLLAVLLRNRATRAHALSPRAHSTGASIERAGSALPRAWLAEALPLLACTLLFATMAIGSERLWAALRFEGPSPEALQVEVVGVQFQWYFRYPGADAHFGATRPQLVDAAAGNPLGLDPADAHAADDFVSSVLMLPVGREVDLRLRAQDVMHGFFVPGMRLKQNAVPGLELHVHFTPQAPGDYPILCTQVCGSGHTRMQAVLRVVSPGAYAGWLAKQGEARARLVAATFALQAPSGGAIQAKGAR